MLSNDTLHPLVIGILETYSIQRELVNVLSNYIPLYWYQMTHSLDYLQPKLLHKTDLVVMFRPIAVNLYLTGKLPNLRFITNLYTIYLSICVVSDSPIKEYDDIIDGIKNKNTFRFYIIDESTEHLLRILFHTKDITFIVIRTDDLNKKMDPDGIYILWTTEYSQPLIKLAKYNKYRIIKLTPDHPILQKIKKEYPAIRITKYDISLQHASNVERVIYALNTKMAIYSVHDSPDDMRINTFIRTYFNFLEKLRTEVESTEAKHTFEELRVENLIEMVLVPYHTQVYDYFRELQLITYTDNPICKNVIGSIPCDVNTLYNNRMKLMFAPHIQS
jgi:TRAP-type uncharacterized transport system substrate-binding protein